MTTKGHKTGLQTIEDTLRRQFATVNALLPRGWTAEVNEDGRTCRLWCGAEVRTTFNYIHRGEMLGWLYGVRQALQTLAMIDNPTNTTN
jgi:hypothetical protein